MNLTNKEIIILIFGFIGLIIVINIIKVVIDFFSNGRRYKEVFEIRQAVNSTVRPHLHSLEKKFEMEEAKEGKKENFGKYVFEIFKDKFKGKDEKIVEKEICRCCNEYEKAECKEDYCLAGAGISCNR